MVDFYDFLNEYLTIDYSPNHQALYCYINKVEDNKLFLITTSDFEKTGLLVGDTLKCKIEEDESEYFFEAQIIDMKSGFEGLNLVITPISEIEEFFNLRTEKRLSYKFIAFTDKNVLASVKNISNSGFLISTTAQYKKGDTIILKLVTSYPHVEYTLSGIIVRVTERADNKHDYGIKINRFTSKEDEEKYKDFVESIYRKLLPL